MYAGCVNMQPFGLFYSIILFKLAFMFFLVKKILFVMWQFLNWTVTNDWWTDGWLLDLKKWTILSRSDGEHCGVRELSQLVIFKVIWHPEEQPNGTGSYSL